MWEYKTIYKGSHDVDLHNMQQFLNTEGKEGWELVQVISKPNRTDPFYFSSHTFIFKKPTKT